MLPLLLLLAASGLRADTLSYKINIQTPGLSGSGSIEFQFIRQPGVPLANALFSISPSGSLTFAGGSTGAYFFNGDAAIPSVSPTTFLMVVSDFGQGLRVSLNLDKPGSDFLVFIRDSGMNSLGTLPSGEVARISIDQSWVSTVTGSTFTGGSADVTPLPEPSAFWLVAIGVTVFGRPAQRLFRLFRNSW